MPVSYSFNANILRMEFEGFYSSETIIESFEEALSDPQFPAHNARLLLNVNRSESLVDRSVDDLRRVAEYFAQRADRVGRRCAIVAETAVHFGLMRMAVVFADSYEAEARVFKKEDEAIQWLNRDLPAATD